MRGNFAAWIRALFADARAQQPSDRERELIDQLAKALAKGGAPTP